MGKGPPAPAAEESLRGAAFPDPTPTLGVHRLRMEGKSFREIGRGIGVSQVAAWKLWQQTVEDVADQVFAEQEGLRLLIEACRKRDAGDPEPLRRLFQKVSGRFGVRVAARFLGSPDVSER